MKPTTLKILKEVLVSFLSWLLSIGSKHVSNATDKLTKE